MTQITGEIITSIDALVDALAGTIESEPEGYNHTRFYLRKQEVKDLIRDFIDRYNAGKP